MTRDEPCSAEPAFGSAALGLGQRKKAADRGSAVCATLAVALGPPLLVIRIRTVGKGITPFEPVVPPQNMDNVDDLFLYAIENTAGRNNQLAVRQAPEFMRNGANVGKSLKPFDCSQYPPDQSTSSLRFVQGHIICDRIQILNRGISPDYFSHRFNRRFA